MDCPDRYVVWCLMVSMIISFLFTCEWFWVYFYVFMGYDCSTKSRRKLLASYIKNNLMRIFEVFISWSIYDYELSYENASSQRVDFRLLFTTPDINFNFRALPWKPGEIERLLLKISHCRMNKAIDFCLISKNGKITFLCTRRPYS